MTIPQMTAQDKGDSLRMEGWVYGGSRGDGADSKGGSMFLSLDRATERILICGLA